MAVGEALRAVARDILADARLPVDGPAKSEAEAVHDFRREMKRWRALLRLLEPFLGREARRCGTRRATSRARSPARATRNRRSMRSPTSTSTGSPCRARSLATVRARIEAGRGRRRRPPPQRRHARRGCRALDGAGRRGRALAARRADVRRRGERLARGYRAAGARLPDDWAAASGEELHELRKRVVIHRYQMEMVEPLWPRFRQDVDRRSQRLRDRLGKHQDLLVLAGLTAPHQPLAPWRSRLAPAIAARKATHVTARRAPRRAAVRRQAARAAPPA